MIGAGAIGGITAAFTQQAGHNLEIVFKHQALADKIAGQGIHITGIKGEHRVKLKAVKTIADLSGPLDLVLLATKSADCLAAAMDLLPLLTRESMVVSLQNGIAEHALSRVLGKERVIGCVAGFNAVHYGPGELEVTSPGEFVIGNIENIIDHRLPPNPAHARCRSAHPHFQQHHACGQRPDPDVSRRIKTAAAIKQTAQQHISQQVATLVLKNLIHGCNLDFFLRPHLQQLLISLSAIPLPHLTDSVDQGWLVCSFKQHFVHILRVCEINGKRCFLTNKENNVRYFLLFFLHRRTRAINRRASRRRM